MRTALACFVLLSFFPAAPRAGTDPGSGLPARAEKARKALVFSKKCMDAWLALADERTGLLPQNERGPGVWTPENSAADLYPFLVLASRFLDRPLFEGRMREILDAEIFHTDRLDRLPDAWSFRRRGFLRDEPDTGRIIFGASEYVKDGLLPVMDLLGRGPWFERARGLVEDIMKHAPVRTRFGPIPDEGAEVCGEMLQSLSRLYCATGDGRYLDWACRIGDAWFFEVLPANHGLPVHSWDFERHRALRDVLSLNDHGNEIVGGLAELYTVLARKDKRRAARYEKPFRRMLRELLSWCRNEDGLWYSLVRPQDRAVLRKGTPDTWGYALTAVYMGWLSLGDRACREAVRRALASLPKPAYAKWNGADSYADSIEGALLLLKWERDPGAESWVDGTMERLLALQRSDGIIEGWYGDGNSIRTALMFALWKSRGTWVEPWREDLALAAEETEGGGLRVYLESKRPWKGILHFDFPRHVENLGLPLDYPRLNQFPEYFTVDLAGRYLVKGLPGEKAVAGSLLRRGLPLKAGGEGRPLVLEVRPLPRNKESVGRAVFPFDGSPLKIEAEELAGPWNTQTNYSGYSGWGFRVSNARGRARTVLKGTLRASRALRVKVWARGLITPGLDRSFRVQVGDARFPPTHGTGTKEGFFWRFCGETGIPKGEVRFMVEDAGDSWECPDALFFSADPSFDPRKEETGGFPPPAGGKSLRKANAAALVRLARKGAEKALPASVLRARAARALGLDPRPPRTPLHPVVTGRLERDGYAIEKVLIESRPGMRVPCNLYLPRPLPGKKVPAVLCPVGHWRGAKAEPRVQARGIGLARLGFAALIYDPMGQGERAARGNRHTLGLYSPLAGWCNMTCMVWDSMRALDYLASREEVDPSRLGVTGCSGGGLNTLYLSVVDSRLKAAAPVCYVAAFSSFLATGIYHCPCSHVPGMASFTDMGRLAGLFAPKPQLLEGGARAPMFTEAGLRKAFGQAMEGYKAAGAPAALELFVDDCAHDYSRNMRERMYAFMVRALQGRDAEDRIHERPWNPEKAESLYCFPGGRLPRREKTWEDVVTEEVKSLLERPRAADERLKRLAGSFSAVKGLRLKADGPGEKGVLSLRDELGFRGRCRLQGEKSGETPLVVLGSHGPGPSLAKALADRGIPWVFLEPPFSDPAAGGGRWAETSGLLLGIPPVTLQAGWLAAAVRLFGGGGEPRILALDRKAALAALGAAVLLGKPVKVLALQGPSSWFDLWDRGFALPWKGAFAGDIPEILEALARRGCRISWAGTVLTEFVAGIEIHRGRLGPGEAAGWLQTSR